MDPVGLLAAGRVSDGIGERGVGEWRSAACRLAVVETRGR